MHTTAATSLPVYARRRYRHSPVRYLALAVKSRREVLRYYWSQLARSLARAKYAFADLLQHTRATYLLRIKARRAFLTSRGMSVSHATRERVFASRSSGARARMHELSSPTVLLLLLLLGLQSIRLPRREYATAENG